MQDSIFTKIIKGEIPGEVIYEDETCFVILTIEPLTEGHMLVIPREQTDSLWDVDQPVYTHLFNVAKQMQSKIKNAYPDYERVGLLVEGFGVSHAHIHVLGFHQPLEPTIEKHVEWKKGASSPDISSDTLRTVAEKLRAV